jgi:hypothetical protein
MRFESSLGAIGLAVVAVVAISQTSLAQSPIDKTLEPARPQSSSRSVPWLRRVPRHSSLSIPTVD